MTVSDALALFLVMALLALLPSTSVALVVARSASAGIAHGAAAAAGIVLGDLAFITLAILGMSTLAELMGGVFFVVRCLAGAYLIWLGISLLRTASAGAISASETPASRLSGSFLAGLLVTLGDAKAILFYASLFPVFVNLAAIDGGDLVVIFSVTVLAVGGAKLFYAWSASRLSRRLRNARVEKGARLAAGGLMLGAGTYLVVKP